MNNSKPTELQISHIAGYLPHELKAVDDNGKIRTVDWFCQSYTNSLVGLNHVLGWCNSGPHKPMLKPLTKLTDEECWPIGLVFREIELNEARPADKIFAVEDARAWIRTGMKPVLSLQQSLEVTNYLYSIHADINFLIDAGLAVEKE